jgi:rhodanese-related sulfurtransferase
MRHFSARELQHHLAASETMPLLLDVREEWEYEYCHIAGSILIPMGQIPARLEELDKKQEIVVICHHGIRSRHIGIYLEHAGFDNVINLEGGVEQWATDVEPTMQRY